MRRGGGRGRAGRTGVRGGAGRRLRRRRAPAAALAAALLALPGCALVAPLPPPVDVAARLAALPTDGLPLERPVTIRWNRHLVPWIEAGTDADAAFALGLVHAHLRLGQMEVARRVAAGRLSEMAGPFAVGIDRALRILGLGRGVGQTLAALPPDTRAWIDAYVAGINHYRSVMAEPPHEFRVLGLDRGEPWRPHDVLTLGRLAGADVNWLAWFSLLPLREHGSWPRIWREALDLGGAGPGAGLPGREAQAGLRLAAPILAGYARSGSNSVAVAGARSRSGAALMASDPHLGLMLPNLFVIAGLRSPSYHAVGLTAPGLPAFILGRNRQIAWGGTNLRAASSDLVDVGGLPPEAFAVERSDIAVRYWFDSSVAVRLSPYGPVISDAGIVPAPAGRTLALRWAGHAATDELTALLRASRARDFAEFREAFAGFAVPGQNMLYADAAGNIGHLAAARLPRRDGAPADIIVDIAAHEAAWADPAGTMQLPVEYNPARGYVASANNPPFAGDVPLGFFFSAGDRAARLGALVEEAGTVDAAMLMAWQRDTLSPTSRVLRDRIVARADAVGLAPGAGGAEALAALRRWDGHYRVDSRGALAFEAAAAALAPELYRTLGQPEDLEWASWSGGMKAKLVADLDRLGDGAAARLLGAALAAAGRALDRHRGWGAVHRLEMAHGLANLPLIGGRYRFGDYPVGGTGDSLMKTAHEAAAGRHPARYGSQSRHVSDLADPDANHFVLLGGQDGRFNSPAFLDQLELWRQGRYIRMPLTAPAVRAAFPLMTELRPAVR